MQKDKLYRIIFISDCRIIDTGYNYYNMQEVYEYIERTKKEITALDNLIEIKILSN